MGSKNGEVELNNFFIFNSLYGNCEGEEHKKILFYHPMDHTDTQIKNMGLAEAIIQFTASFKPDGPVNSVHTQKRRQLFYQPESNFWMVMTLNVPQVKKVKDGIESVEYLEDDVQDNVYESVLRQSYELCRLFSGQFERTVAKHNVEVLKTRLEQFYSPYLASLKLQHCDVLSRLNGMQFLPLDKRNFLTVQCFTNELQCEFPIVTHVTFLYNDHLVWSGIGPDDMQVIYEYLITTLLPAQVGNELLGGSMPRHRSPFAVHHGRFITGPVDLKDATPGKVPKVHLREAAGGVFHLLVYRVLSASICLFVNASEILTVELFGKLDEFMGPRLAPLVSDVAEYTSKQLTSPSSTSEAAPRFIYFNKLNLAYKSTVHLNNKRTGNVNVSAECLKLIADINGQKEPLGYSGELILKTMNDYWVVGKVSNLREFYVVLQQKNASLIDISEEVRKLCDNELKGIFFHST